jgi:outer membrane protein assembly factor BamB
MRAWPAVVAAVLLAMGRFILPMVVPARWSFFRAVPAGMLGSLLVVLWWLLASRTRWRERLGGLLLAAGAFGLTWLLRHESMGPVPFIAWAVPIFCLVVVASAVATRGLDDRRRRAVMGATALVFSLGWLLVRTEGVGGDHVSRFHPRWTPTPEERLLAEAAPLPAPRPAASLAPPPAAEPSSAPFAPSSPPSAAPERRPSATTEWPGFRGPRRDGVVRGARIDTDWSASPPRELWRQRVGPGWSSFAVGGGRVYTQEQRGDDEVVSCLDLATGAAVWRHADRARFVESNAGVGPRATPTLHGGRAYAFGATGILNALDASTGKPAWSRDVAKDTGAAIPYWGFSSSPLVVDDLVIVAAAGQLAAYDRATGDRRWAGAARRDGYSSPHLVTIGGTAQVVLLSDSGATGVRPGDGAVLWEHPFKGTPIVQPAVTADGDLLVSASGGMGTRRIALAADAGGWTAKERWTSPALKPYFNDYVVHEGHAYGFDGRILAAIDLRDGARKWKGGRYGNGQLVLLADQDLLLVLSEEGELALVKAAPDAFTEVARAPAIQGKTWNHPVLVDDVLLVRNAEEMAAFRLAR